MSDRPRQCGSDRQNDNKLVLEIFVNVSCLLALRGIVSLGKLIFERIEKQSCFSRIACQSKKEKLLISFYEIQRRKQPRKMRHERSRKLRLTRIRAITHADRSNVGALANPLTFADRVSVHGEKTRLTDTFASVRERNLWTMCRS